MRLKSRLVIALKICLLFFIAISSNCTNNDYENQEADARKTFFNNITSKQKQIVKEFLEGTIKKGDKFSGITGGFYCLWKRGNIDISPYISLNDMFLNENFNITTKGDNLNYIVIAENITHNTGHYTNGGVASKLRQLFR